MASMARMRTIPQVMDYFKREDPDGSISEYYLRTLVKTKPKQIGVFKSGSRNLLNLDKLLDYLNSEPVEEDEIPFSYGTIRKVCE